MGRWRHRFFVITESTLVQAKQGFDFVAFTQPAGIGCFDKRNKSYSTMLDILVPKHWSFKEQFEHLRVSKGNGQSRPAACENFQEACCGERLAWLVDGVCGWQEDLPKTNGP